MINIFSKTIIQKEANYGESKLPRIIVAGDFSPSSFILKKGMLHSLGKYVSLSYQAKILFLN